jgi:hypothetical protein
MRAPAVINSRDSRASRAAAFTLVLSLAACGNNGTGGFANGDGGGVDGGADASALDAAGSPFDASTVDAALVGPSNWTFAGERFEGTTPFCAPVMTWFSVLSNTSGPPWLCSVDIFLPSMPAGDATYAVTATTPQTLQPGQAVIVVTDERTGGVEQWDSSTGGEVVVQFIAGKMHVEVHDAVVHGAVDVPAGTPDQIVNAVFDCP